MAERNRFLDIITPKLTGQSEAVAAQIAGLTNASGKGPPDGGPGAAERHADQDAAERGREDYRQSIVNPPEKPFPGKVR